MLAFFAYYFVALSRCDARVPSYTPLLASSASRIKLKIRRNLLLAFFAYYFVRLKSLSIFAVFMLLSFRKKKTVVENKGFEPLTPCVQGRCSPS